MSYETEEQQVEALKEWWKENGTPLVVGAILGLAGFAGWKYWNQQQVSYQENASDLYNQVSETLKTEDKKGLAESAMAVKKDYPESSYAILSSFHLAKLAVDENDLDKAAVELNWIIDNHQGNEMVSMAKIRLARILIEQDKASDALPLVKMDEDSGYYALASLVKGNALIALDKPEEALIAYKVASADLEIAARHPSLQLKIDELTASNSLISKTEIETTDTQESNDSEEAETKVEPKTEQATEESK